MALTKIRGSQIQDYSIGNAHIDPTSPIVYSNLDLSNSLVASDLSINHTVHTDVLDYKLIALWDMVQNLTVSGTSTVVTAEVQAAALTDTATMDGSAKGILTTGSGANGVGIENYKVQVRDAITKDPVADFIGGSVYGQLTSVAGAYTLSFFKSDATTFTMGQSEIVKINTLANTNGKLDGKYFTIATPTVKYAVMFANSGTVGEGPSIPGYTVKIVTVDSGATAETVAAALANATIAGISLGATGNEVTLTITGGTLLEHVADGKGTSETGFTFAVNQYGTPSKIDFMFEEIYSLNTAPLKGFVTGVGFADIVSTTGSHNHNDLYYSKSELEAGQLDDRYYTEAELDAGQLDNRYFTESELSGGSLDARYYTETELGSTANGSSGADKIGISGITNIAAGTVQGAIAEIQGDIDNIVSGGLDIKHSLDDAYNDGSVIAVDNTNVDFELATGKTFKIADATDTSKFVISQGHGIDSVKIATSGGIDIDAGDSIILNQNGSIYNEVSVTAAYSKVSSNNNVEIHAFNGSASLISEINTGADAIKIAAAAGGINIDSKKDIDIASEAAIKIKDVNLTASIPVSETGVAALSTNLTKTSIIGAINENADNLHTLIATTLPATADGAAGADKIGVTGITGIIPTGGTIGANGTVQSMLEGIALSAGGGKTFANITDFTTAKAGGTYFKANEIVYILSVNREVEVLTQGTAIVEDTDWKYIAGTAAKVGGASYNFNPDTFNVDSQTITLDSENNINLTAPNIVGTGDLTLTTKSWISAGNIKISSVDPTDEATISGSRSGTVNAANKLINSGFEQGAGTTASNWTFAGGITRTEINRYYGSYATHAVFNQTTETEYTVMTQATSGLTANTKHVVSFYVLGKVGTLGITLNGGATKFIAGATYADWTRVNVTLDADNAASGDFIIKAAGLTGANDFYIDAIMVSEGEELVDYFSSYQSELAITIGNNDDDRIVFRSSGTATKDLVRINQSTVEVLGNLLVSGTTTTVNSEDLLVADNQIVLNSNVTGAPSLDAFFKVKRGTSADASIRWNESTDKWELTTDGSIYSQIVTTGTGAGGLTLDGAYDGGSEVSVDNTNVVFTLAAAKKFVVADGTDTAKVAITAGSAADSVAITTSGGVGINTINGFKLFNTSSVSGVKSKIEIAADGTISVVAGSGTGTIDITTNDMLVTANRTVSISGDVIEFNSNTRNITLTSGNNVGITGKEINISGTAASVVKVTGADLTLSTITSGNIVLTSAGELKFGDSRLADIEFTDATYKTLPGGATSIVGAINVAYQVALDNANTFNEVYDTENGSDHVITVDNGNVDWNVTDGYKFAINDSAAVALVSVEAKVDGDEITVNGNLTATGKTQKVQAVGTGSTLTLSSEGSLSASAADAITITGHSIVATAAAASSITATGGLTLASATSGDVKIQSAGEVSLKDSRTATYTFSDASNTLLPASKTSIIGAINAAYNHVGNTVVRAYNEIIATSTDVTNDYVVTSISLFPASNGSPSALRALSDPVHAVVYLNGLRLSDTEWNYVYDIATTEKRIAFNGSNNITLVTGDIIMVDVEKITTPATFAGV